MAESPLTSYLRIQRASDQDTLKALRAAATRIELELRSLQAAGGLANEIRANQLLYSVAEINRQMSNFWLTMGDATQAYKAEAAATGAETVLRGTNSLLSRVFSATDVDYMVESTRASAIQNLSNLDARLSGESYRTLSESVYDNAALTSGKVDEIVNSAIARGASAADLARDVRDFVNPNTPGGARYASLRLGRTELNNAFHASQIREGEKLPWVTGLEWNLSGSHPVPDECNDYAAVGVYAPDKVPAKPHPNCLCFTTPEAVSREDFLNQFNSGAYDSFLDREYPDLSA